MAGIPATGKQTLGMLVSPMRRPRPPAMLMDAIFRCGPPIVDLGMSRARALDAFRNLEVTT